MTKNTKKTLLGGGISLVITLVGALLIHELSGYETKEVIKDSVDGLNTLCNTIALASATILALLLITLGISANAKLKNDHFENVLSIAKLDTAVFVASLISFLIFNLPIADTDKIPAEWYNFI